MSIERVGSFKYCEADFSGFRVQNVYMDGKVGRKAPTGSAWLEKIGLVVRYSQNKVALATVGTVASATVEMARDIPALRVALMEALAAMEPDSGSLTAAAPEFTRWGIAQTGEIERLRAELAVARAEVRRLGGEG